MYVYFITDLHEGRSWDGKEEGTGFFADEEGCVKGKGCSSLVISPLSLVRVSVSSSLVREIEGDEKKGGSVFEEETPCHSRCWIRYCYCFCSPGCCSGYCFCYYSGCVFA